MASKPSASAAFFLVLNLLFFAMATACDVCPSPSPSPSFMGECPMNALKLGVCADVLDGLINIGLGKPPKNHCCSLFEGLLDFEASACLCIAFKANVLGIELDLSIELDLLLNYCGKKVPKGFQCA